MKYEVDESKWEYFIPNTPDMGGKEIVNGQDIQ